MGAEPVPFPVTEPLVHLPHPEAFGPHAARSVPVEIRIHDHGVAAVPERFHEGVRVVGQHGADRDAHRKAGFHGGVEGLEPRGHGGGMGREIAADGLVVRFERQVQLDPLDALQHVEVPADHGAAGLHDEPVRLQAGEHLQALARDPVLRLGALVGVRGGTQEYPYRPVPLFQTGHLGLEPFGRVDLDVHVVAPGPAVVEVDGQGLHVAVGATVHAADVGLQGMGVSFQEPARAGQDRLAGYFTYTRFHINPTGSTSTFK